MHTRRIPDELPEPVTVPVPADAPVWRALGRKRRALVSQAADGEAVYLLQRSGSRMDTGSWFGKRQVWLAFTPAALVMVATGPRPVCQRIPLAQLGQSQVNVVTGDVVFAPAELPLQQVSLSPVAAAQVLAQIRRRDKC